jgi:hypothetical protein
MDKLHTVIGIRVLRGGTFGQDGKFAWKFIVLLERIGIAIPVVRHGQGGQRVDSI